MLWAAKEAAYKFFSNESAARHFVPRQFETQIEGHDPTGIYQRLSVAYSGLRTDAFIFTEKRWVHAVVFSPAMRVKWAVRENKSCAREPRAAESESEAVRSLTNVLVYELGLDDVALTFEGRIPKLKRVDGSASPMAVSLSHHGAFVAAAIAWPAVLSFPSLPNETTYTKSNGSEGVCFTCTV